MPSASPSVPNPSHRLALVLRDAQYAILAIIAGRSVLTPYEFLTYRWAFLVIVVTLMNPFAGRRPSRADLMAVAFVALTIVSSAWSVAPGLTSTASQATAACVALFVAVRRTVVNIRGLWIVGGGLLVGSMISVKTLLGESGGQASLRYDVVGPRIGLSGLNPNYSSYALAGAAALVVLLAYRYPRAILVLSTLVFFLYSALLLTGARGGVAAILGVVLWAVWWRVGRRMRAVSLRVLLCGVLVIALAIFTGAADGVLKIYASEQGLRDLGDLNGRLTVWPVARRLFLDQPVFGFGAGTFPNLNRLAIYAHNAPLDIASGLGVLGLVIFAALLVFAVRETKNVDPSLRSLAAGLFVAASAPPLLSGYWYLTPTFWLLFALFTSACNVLGTTAPVQATVFSAPVRTRPSAVTAMRRAPAEHSRAPAENVPALLRARSREKTTREARGGSNARAG